MKMYHLSLTIGTKGIL